MAKNENDQYSVFISCYDSPLDVAKKLIDLRRRAYTTMDNLEYKFPAFNKEQLRRIGQHLLLESEE